LAASFIIEWQTSRLRRTEAADGAQRDAEVAAGRAARLMGRNDGLARLVSDERTGQRWLAVWNEDGTTVAGSLPARAQRTAADAANQGLNGLGSGHGVRAQSYVVGGSPVVRDDAVIGAVVIVERAPAAQSFTGPAQLAVLPGA